MLLRKKIKIKITAVILLCLLLSSRVEPAGAVIEPAASALLYFAVDKASFLDPDYLEIEIAYQGGQEEFNLLSLGLYFPPSLLSLEEAAVSGNCGLVIREGVDNSAGGYYLACASPAVIADTAIARLKFRKLRPGWAALAFNSADGYRADGSGRSEPLIAMDNYINIAK